VITVRDFSLVFDALTQFEESLISAKMDQMASDDEAGDGAAVDEDGSGTDFLLKDDGNDLDLRWVGVEGVGGWVAGRALGVGGG
jgi:pre-mRNA-splicing factor SYF1